MLRLMHGNVHSAFFTVTFPQVERPHSLQSMESTNGKGKGGGGEGGVKEVAGLSIF